MTLYNHPKFGFSDEADLAHRTKFRSWDKRLNPSQAYADSGWVIVTEVQPAYDGSVVTGQLSRVMVSSSQYEYRVNDRPWSTAVDVIANAEQKCRAAIDAAVETGKALMIPYTLPAGSQLNNVDAAGQQVNLPLVHPILGEDYWIRVGTSLPARGFNDIERFGAFEGRIDVPKAFVSDLLKTMASIGSPATTKRLDLEDAFLRATSEAEYDAIRNSITA